MGCSKAVLHLRGSFELHTIFSAARVQVDLIMMGERYRQLLDRGLDPWQQAQAERNAPSFADVVSLPRHLKLPSPAWCCNLADNK